MRFPRGRRRHVETTDPFCPPTPGAYHGRVGWGNLRANGHPNGRRWRQLGCLGGTRHCLETHGTPFHAKQGEPDTRVWVIAALAEGLGIRAVARVLETDPPTVWGGLGEAADPREAFARHVLRDLDVEPGQLDARCAGRSAVKAGEGSARPAITCLSRSPHGVWGALDPVGKRRVAGEGGARTLALAQRLGPQGTAVRTPHCAPLFLTGGWRDSLTALVTHSGDWRQAERRQAPGPQPTPRWRPGPGRLSAPVVTCDRRRRLVGGTYRLLFGPAAPIASILAKRGWKIHAACIERRPLDVRPQVAALGWRGKTRCTHEAGWRQQRTLFHADHNVVLPHARVRLPLPALELDSRDRSHQALAAADAGDGGRMDGSGLEGASVLLYRVPPWPHTQRGEALGRVEDAE